MKKNLFLFIAVIAMTSFLSCADKTDEGVISTSKLQIYGQNYALTSGVIWEGSKYSTAITEEYVFVDTYVNEEGETITDNVIGFKASDEVVEAGNIMVSLYEEGLRYNSDIAMTRGKGALVSLHFASSDFEKLVPGKYLFSNEKKANTFSGYSSSYYDMETGTDKPATLASGEVEVKMEGDKYRINFNCKTTFGGEVKGEYFGPLMSLDVKRDALAISENIELSGIQKGEIPYIQYFFGNPEPGESYDTFDAGVFSTKLGIGSTTDAAENSLVDIAVLFDEDSKSIHFETPLKIRVQYAHDDSFTFPCHTVYKLAPADFTDSNFDTITEFDFEITEEEAIIEMNPDNFRPIYVFFKAGNGTKGVIKVKDIKPIREAKQDIMAGIWWLSYTSSPTINVDIKYSANFANPTIR